VNAVNERTHKIYALVDPRTNEVRYIGKSVNPEQRYTVHLAYARKGTQTYACRWIKGLLNEGLAPQLNILESDISTDRIDEREIWWIAEGARLGWRLTNMTEGGDGGAYKYPESAAKISAANKGKRKPPRSEEHRRNQSLSHMGKTLSPESRAKLSASLMGHASKPMSEEHKAKLRAINTTRVQTEEEKAKRAAAGRGKKRSAEARANISAGLKRRHFVHPPEVLERIAEKKRGTRLSEETKAKMSASHKGKKKSPEHVAKVAAANRGRIVSPETRAKLSAAAKARHAAKKSNQQEE
jgi:hypothetical protein